MRIAVGWLCRDAIAALVESERDLSRDEPRHKMLQKLLAAEEEAKDNQPRN